MTRSFACGVSHMHCHTPRSSQDAMSRFDCQRGRRVRVHLGGRREFLDRQHQRVFTALHAIRSPLTDVAAWTSAMAGGRHARWV